jgi:hypothetical protein
VVSQDVAPLFELVGVNFPTCESLLENALRLWMGVSPLTFGRHSTWAVVELVVAVSECADHPDEGEYDEHEEKQNNDAVPVPRAPSETRMTESLDRHVVTSFSTYSRSRRFRDAWLR